MEMCRFMGLDDVEYKKVAAALCRITTTLSKQPTTVERLSLDKEQKQALLDSLRFDQIDARQMNIKKAHAKTCKWLLEKPEYLDWLDPSKLPMDQREAWDREVDADEVCSCKCPEADDGQDCHLLLL
jgi:hypothetical protein